MVFLWGGGKMGVVFLRVGQSPRIKVLFFTKRHKSCKKKKKIPYCVPSLAFGPHSLYIASRGGGAPEAVAPGDALARRAAGREGPRRALQVTAPWPRGGPLGGVGRASCTPVFTTRAGGRPQSTARLWQDLERALRARRRALRAVRRAKKRRARWPKLARRRGAGESRALPSWRRRRSWRTTPSKSSATLCCRVAEVSMNLQSNTTAQARPSGRRGQAGVEEEIKVGSGVFSLDGKQFVSFPQHCARALRNKSDLARRK